MSWLYDDQDLSNQAQAAAAAPDSATTIHPTDDFELFHEQVAPIEVDQPDLAPAAADQGIKHVRVRNLQWWTNENTIRELLTDCGVIKSIDFEASMKNGKSLGIANIEFDSSDAALRAIDRIDNREIDGKPVNANLLVMEDVKMSQSQPQQRPVHHSHNPGRNRGVGASPRRPPVRSPPPPASRTGPHPHPPPHRTDPPAVPDLSRLPNAPARGGSTAAARAGKPVDHRHDVDRAASTTALARSGGDWGRSPPPPPPPPYHGTSSASGGGGGGGHTDRGHIRARSSHHDHTSRRPEPAIHRDRERLIRAAERGGSHRPSSSARLPDSHHAIDGDLSSRRSSYPDDRPHSSSHSRRAESERSSRDLRSDHDRSSRHGSHRDLDDGRLSSSRRGLHEYSKDHGSSGYERHAAAADRHDHGRPEPDHPDRYAHRHDSDHRSRKRRR